MPVQSSLGIRIKSKEDLNRVLLQIQKREAIVSTLQKKLALKGAALDKAEKKLKKRSDFLDAWEVSLKNKEAELVEEQEEIERIKTTLRKAGEQILALSQDTQPVFESIPFEEEVFEDVPVEEMPEERKSFLGFLKGKTKKPGRVVRSPPERSQPSKGNKQKSLRDVLEAKRDKLKSVSTEELTLDEMEQDEPLPTFAEEPALDEAKPKESESVLSEDHTLKELEELAQEVEAEVYSCPTCDEEITVADDVCPSCGAELSWD